MKPVKRTLLWSAPILLGAIGLSAVVIFLRRQPPPLGGNLPPGPEWYNEHVREFADPTLAALSVIYIAVTALLLSVANAFLGLGKILNVDAH